MKRWALVVLVVLVPGGAIVAGLWWWMRRKVSQGERRSRWATQARRDKCDPELVAKVDATTAALDAAGHPVVVTDGHRFDNEQNALADRGALGSGGVTNARAGQSPHNVPTGSCAADLAPMDASGNPTWPEDPAVWNRIGETAERFGLSWGGRWRTPDRPHVELPDWKARRDRARGLA